MFNYVKKMDLCIDHLCRSMLNKHQQQSSSITSSLLQVHLQFLWRQFASTNSVQPQYLVSLLPYIFASIFTCTLGAFCSTCCVTQVLFELLYSFGRLSLLLPISHPKCTKFYYNTLHKPKSYPTTENVLNSAAGGRDHKKGHSVYYKHFQYPRRYQAQNFKQ